VFPNTHDAPAQGFKGRRVPHVARDVALDLATPEVIDLFAPTLEVVAMPEIAIDEHGNTRSREHDVGAPGEAADVLSEAESTAVKSRSDGLLDVGVLTANVCHAAAALSWSQVVGHMTILAMSHCSRESRNPWTLAA
jgi:hypothetical protein